MLKSATLAAARRLAVAARERNSSIALIGAVRAALLGDPSAWPSLSTPTPHVAQASHFDFR
jgi:hypothetical protein